MGVDIKMTAQIDQLQKDIFELRYDLKLCLSALRNILDQRNPNDVNKYLIKKIEERL
jgi:hypothetical protein